MLSEISRAKNGSGTGQVLAGLLWTEALEQQLSETGPPASMWTKPLQSLVEIQKEQGWGILQGT